VGATTVERRYWAFISYSHMDHSWAKWLHRALETYAVPRRLVGVETPDGPAPRRLRPIFKDREDLPVDADLRGRVDKALRQSACLIVICSPNAARSLWVRDEILRFKSIHGESRVFAVIVGGTPRADPTQGRDGAESFPDALRFHVDTNGDITAEAAEIIAADLRHQGDGRRLALLKIVAGMLGVDLDDLVRRDALRRGQQLTSLSVASVAVALVMGALALAAIKSRDEARVQRGHADSFIDFMIGDLDEKLRPSGQLDVLDSIAEKAISYYESQKRSSLSADELGQRARVLHLLGEISDQRGDLRRAAIYFAQATDSTRDLVARDPHNTQRIFERAQSAYWEGYIAQRRGDEKDAASQFVLYQQLMQRLVGRDPKNEAWLIEEADAHLAVGTVLFNRGEGRAAASAFSSALEVNQKLSASKPADRGRAVNVIGNYAWLADAEVQERDFGAAMRDRTAERVRCEELLKIQPDDNEISDALVVARMAMANIYLKEGKYQEVRNEAVPAIGVSYRLMATDTRNTVYQEHAAKILIILAQADLRDNILDAAADAASHGEKIAEGLAHEDSAVALWRGALLGEARITVTRVAAQRSRKVESLRDALASAEPEAERLLRLLQESPSDFPLAEVSAEASLLAGDFEQLSGSVDIARHAWSIAANLLRQERVAQPMRFSARDQQLLQKVQDRISNPTWLRENKLHPTRMRGDVEISSEMNYAW